MYCEGVVHLSGYVMPEDEFPGIDDMAESDEEAEEEEEEELESDDDMTLPSISYLLLVV